MKRFFQILLIGVFLLPSQAWSLDVIPGLKVFGGTTRAAYGNSTNPTIYIVNTLNPTTAVADSSRNGVAVKTGGLDAILETAGDNKLIIFEVSGNIDGGGQSTVYIAENYITIAGQTAPSPGITLQNYKMQFGGHDVLIQHIRTRMTDSPKGTDYDSRDGLNITNYSTTSYAQNVVMDHCSISWATDENVGIGGSIYSQNLSVSNCIIAEGLVKNRHTNASNGHSKGLITGGGTNIGVINNLFISNYDRNPYVTNNGDVPIQFLVANNFIYNTANINMVFATRTTVDKYSIVGNVIEGGPDSGFYASDRIITLLYDQNDSSEIYIDNNQCDDGEGTYTQASANDWTRVREASGVDNSGQKVLSIPFPYPAGYTPMDSSLVKAYVLAHVGARPTDRDTVDTRLIGDATNNTGDLIDTVLYTSADCTGSGEPFFCCTGSGTGTCDQVDEGGFPALAENTVTHNDLPSNPHADDDSDGYTNLEEWLHSFTAVVEGKSFSLAPPTAPPTGLAPPIGLTIHAD